MSSGRLRRFLNLERPRRTPSDEPTPEERARFRGVERPSQDVPAAAPVPVEATDRFREPRERPLDLVERSEEAQPFVRCLRCEMDNSVYAPVCQNCGADLSAADQRAYNERLWAQRREQSAREQAERVELERERERLAAEGDRARRELAVEMARREGDRIRDELDEARWGGAGGWGRWRAWDGSGGPAALGVRLLRLIPSRAARAAALVAAVALPVLLIALGRRSGSLRIAGLLLAVLLVALLAPSHRARRWWNGD